MIDDVLICHYVGQCMRDDLSRTLTLVRRLHYKYTITKSYKHSSVYILVVRMREMGKGESLLEMVYTTVWRKDKWTVTKKRSYTSVRTSVLS